MRLTKFAVCFFYNLINSRDIAVNNITGRHNYIAEYRSIGLQTGGNAL